MDHKTQSMERVKKYLWIVSAITITLVGMYVARLLIPHTLNRFFIAVGSVLLPFVIAFFLSFIVGPLATLIKTKLNLKPSLAAIVSIAIGLIVVFGIVLSAIVFIVTQIATILAGLLSLLDFAQFEGLIGNVYQAINLYLQNSNISSILEEIASNGATLEKLIALLGSVFISLSDMLSNFFSLIFVLVLTPVFLYYLITQKTYIFSSISKVFPKDVRKHIVELGKRSDSAIKNYFKGQGLMMVIITFYNVIGLGILSFFVPEFSLLYALMFALLIGLMNIIPYLGAWIGIAAPVVFLMTKHLEYRNDGIQDPIFIIAVVVVIIWLLIEQVIESSVLQPHVYGKQVHIHPLVVLSSLLFFGGLFGFAGVLLAVPMAGTIKSSVYYLVEVREQQNKEVAPESSKTTTKTRNKSV